MPATHGLCVLLAQLTPPGAQSNAAHTAWYQVAYGIILIPVALVGLYYTIALIRSTNATTRKTMIEIREAEVRLATHEPTPPEVASLRATAIARATSFQLVVLRFIVFYLILQAYGLVQEIYGLMWSGFTSGVIMVVGLQRVAAITSGSFGFLLWTLLGAIGRLPEIGYWLIFFGIGWPILRDANEVVGIRLRDIFRIRRRHRAL